MGITSIISLSVAIAIALVFLFFLKKNDRKIKQPPKKLHPSIVSALSSLFDGEKDEAIQKFKDMAFKGNANSEIYLILGFLFKSNGDYIKSTQVYEMILGSKDIEDDFKNALIGELASNYLYAEQPLKAINLLQKESQVMDDPKNIMVLARSYLLCKNYDLALNNYSKYYKITGKEEIGFFEKCMTQKAVDSKNPQSALKYIKSALSKNDKCRQAHIIKALIFFKMDKVQKAIEECNFIVKNGFLRHIDDFKAIEKIYIALGKEKDLTEILKEETNKGADNPFIHIGLASIYENNDDIASAKILLENYIEQPDSKLIASKIYADKFNNKLISHIIDNAHFFKCKNCGFEIDIYKDDCPKCLGYDTVFTK